MPIFGSHARLTARQREVAALMSDGLSIAKIAVEMTLSIATIRSHVRDLHDKSETHDLIELIRWIRDHEMCCVNSKPSTQPGPSATQQRLAFSGGGDKAALS